MFAMDDVPVHCNRLWSNQEDACHAPKGIIRLVCCRTCGLTYNRGFDESLLQYGEGYENSLHYSPAFQGYAKTLANELIRQYDLNNKDIIEIGCGGGEFLSLLCQGGNNRGVGFDPSCPYGHSSSHNTQSLRIIRDFYSPKYRDYKADMICCRHVLEHLPSPTDMLASVREAIGDRMDTIVFFEVPNSLYSLRDMGVWDIIYEHCTYFNESALTRIFIDEDFEILNVRETFEGQFLCIVAKPASRTKTLSNTLSNKKSVPSDGIEDLAMTFGENFRKKVERWEGDLEYLRREGKTVVIWGAGSKGVTFLNSVKAARSIDYVVDLNPHKHRMFVPGTGQQVISPEALGDIKPDVLLVMNPNYMDEIKHIVQGLHVPANVVCV